MSRRNEKHWLTEEELENGTWGKSLEDAVVELKNLLPALEYAFSGVEFAAAAIRAKELGFDRHTVFWPMAFPQEVRYGMAWKDDPDLVAEIEPPPDREPGWKLDPHYGDRLRHWTGDAWDEISAPAPGNLDLYKKIATGEHVEEEPTPPPILSASTTTHRPTSDDKPQESDDESPTDDEVSAADLRRAEEIAQFVAKRAFEFDDHEARAWALTDFDVWASLAGKSAQLSFD